jgi:hypothetical protein
MNLYIQIENGQPINHPAFEDNILKAFGSIPFDWEPFTRVDMPMPTVYQIFDSQEPTYQKVNGVWTDVWSLRDMTDAEKTAKQQSVQSAWAAIPNASNLSAWIFDETTCSYKPPVPKPTDGKQYFWQGTTNSWVVRPDYPTDGKQYKLDIPTATWVVVTDTPSA